MDDYQHIPTSAPYWASDPREPGDYGRAAKFSDLPKWFQMWAADSRDSDGPPLTPEPDEIRRQLDAFSWPKTEPVVTPRLPSLIARLLAHIGL